jgi:hypothetical protein
MMFDGVILCLHRGYWSMPYDRISKFSGDLILDVLNF